MEAKKEGEMEDEAAGAAGAAEKEGEMEGGPAGRKKYSKKEGKGLFVLVDVDELRSMFMAFALRLYCRIAGKFDPCQRLPLPSSSVVILTRPRQRSGLGA